MASWRRDMRGQSQQLTGYRLLQQECIAVLWRKSFGPPGAVHPQQQAKPMIQFVKRSFVSVLMKGQLFRRGALHDAECPTPADSNARQLAVQFLQDVPP